jgi:hypothetical protein
MVDAPDLKSGTARCEGSSPSPGILDALSADRQRPIRSQRWTAGCSGCLACPYGVYCPSLGTLASEGLSHQEGAAEVIEARMPGAARAAKAHW